MIVIPFIIILVLLAKYRGKWIRKNNTKLYIASVVVAIVTFILRDKIKILEPFIQGFLGLSFLYIVMFTGALRKKSTLYVSLMSIRREYSIIGFILLSTHAFRYLVEFLIGDRGFEWFGVIPFVIMIPLFITSFMKIRKMMSVKTWNKLQQLAYIVYILIFVHLLLVAENLNRIIYIVLFVPYFILKVIKEYKLYKEKK